MTARMEIYDAEGAKEMEGIALRRISSALQILKYGVGDQRPLPGDIAAMWSDLKAIREMHAEQKATAR